MWASRWTVAVWGAALWAAEGCVPPHVAPQSAASAPEFVRYDLVVQLPIDGSWGTDDDIPARYALERKLQRRLGLLALVDGGDIGSGNMNIFLYRITDISSAVLGVKRVLERRGLLEIAIIEQSGYRTDDDPDPVATVIWPLDYQGKFSVF